MKKAVSIPTLIYILLAISCKEQQPFPGYKKIKEDLYYKLYTIGDGHDRPGLGDYLDAHLSIRNLKGDTLFYQPTEVTFRLTKTTGTDTIFRMFNMGDSVSFIWQGPGKVGGVLRNFLDADTLVGAMVDFKIVNSRSKKIYLNDSLAYYDDPVMNEKIKLQKYLAALGLQASDSLDSLYYVPISIGSTERRPAIGQSIRLDYTGRFLNGQLFDATGRWKEPLIIEYGKPQQVIVGIERALSWMNEGDEAKIIIPSQLAFGELGSSNGTVPPYTTVVYELKLTEIY